MAGFDKIAKDVVAVIERTNTIGITDKDVIALLRKYVTKASIYTSMPASGVDLVLARRNITEMFKDTNSLLKIDCSDSDVDAIAGEIISSLERESTVAIAFAAAKWGNPQNYVAQGALNMSVAQITESVYAIYLKSIIRSINDNIELEKAVNKEL